MEYLTVREAAEKWNISPRMVQQFCVTGRIPGAQKFGKSWAIPAATEKPQAARSLPEQGTTGLLERANLMPLMNTPFQPGHCLEAVEAMEPGPRRDIARAEYHYFTAQPEKAAKETEPYLTSLDVGARLSACLIYAYANLSIHQIQHARFALNEAQRALAAGGETAPHLRAAGPLWRRPPPSCSTCPCRLTCPPLRNFCPCSPPACGPSPSTSRPTTSISNRTTPRAWASWRRPWLWGRRSTPSPPSTCT